MGIQSAVRIAVSALVKVPLVVGYLRPMILLPATVMTGLSTAELESLLAHELAHIRRHDWIVNAMQVVLETVLFFHPAVWWLSNRIRQERELCCDDLALTLVQDKARYGRMLLALEELLHHSPTPSLAATGGNLVYRIRRLLPSARPVRRSYNGWLAGCLLLLGMAAASGLSILAAQPAAVETPKSQADRPADEPVNSDKSEDAKDKPADQTTNEPEPNPPIAKMEQTPDDQIDFKLPISATITLEAHDYEPDDPIVDLTQMTANDSHWYTEFPVSRFCEDRWLRSRGWGHLTRGADQRGLVIQVYYCPYRDPERCNKIALAKATCQSDKYRDGKRALELATISCELTKWKNRTYLVTLAAAYAEIGDFARRLNGNRRRPR